MKTYSFFIDDNIFFLKEIAAQKIDSVFDHFFLGGLKKLHEKYQTKFLLNLFKGDQNSGFMLNEFPDRFKEEFQKNKGWLRFSFHAAFDKTHYFDAEGCITSTVEEYRRDYNYVKNEVIRFAGEDSFMVPQVIHYVESTPDIKEFLYHEGVRLLADRRKKFEDRSAAAGKTIISFPDPEVPQLIRIPLEMVINIVKIDDIVPQLSIRVIDEKRNYINIMTHEPQFYRYFRYYLPNHWEKVEKAVGYLTKNGYAPVWGPMIKEEDL